MDLPFVTIPVSAIAISNAIFPKALSCLLPSHYGTTDSAYMDGWRFWLCQWQQWVFFCYSPAFKFVWKIAAFQRTESKCRNDESRAKQVSRSATLPVRKKALPEKARPSSFTVYPLLTPKLLRPTHPAETSGSAYHWLPAQGGAPHVCSPAAHAE